MQKYFGSVPLDVIPNWNNLPRILVLNSVSNQILHCTTEYFAGKKLLQMSTLCDLAIAFWQGSCVFTSNDLDFADFIVAN